MMKNEKCAAEMIKAAPTRTPNRVNMRTPFTRIAGTWICQVIEFFLNMLIIICAGVPYSNTGRYRDIANLGGIYYYYYGGAQAFTPQEAAQVQQLDDRFYQLKIPPYIFTMAAGGALMAYALAVLALGVFRVPFRQPPVLLVESVLDGLISLGYVPAVAFYFIKLKEIYNNQICKDREAMYKSKGFQASECTFSGTDVAEGLFGVMGTLVFCLSAVLAVKAFRAVRKMRQPREVDDNF
ncbi:MARVEL domain-containing protein 3 isoform X2 [Electrophorus electricus]|uniref:MARVEL domain-containing protein n=1 Tax=Electrophorus electricus TaxID=8005 RepID=A0A4W4GTV7_ELEEL|nr:MARVEL domain-containing protein 3 isoform X2 [Electrophorus electricus]